MKRTIFPISSLILLLALSTVLFHACTEDNLQEHNQEITDEARTYILQDPQAVCNDSEDQEYDDDLLINEEASPDQTAAGGDYCVYKIDKIVSSNDPGKSLKKGDKLCYTCPANGQCPQANCVERKLRHTYYNWDGTRCYYYTTVKVSGGGAACTNCPPGGNKLGNSGGLPGS